MKYGYVRVSSIGQNISRQIEEMKKLGLSKKQIFIDTQSGKDFNRRSYLKLKKRLKENDLLIIKSIDRLGRNYNMIIEEWRDINKNIKADILVLDMPLLDTRKENTLIGTFISDIVLQLLSFFSELERNNIRQRQAEGIKIAKEKGVHLGRPKYELPKNFRKISLKYSNKLITKKQALLETNMKLSTFNKYYKIFHFYNALQ